MHRLLPPHCNPYGALGLRPSRTAGDRGLAVIFFPALYVVNRLNIDIRAIHFLSDSHTRQMAEMMDSRAVELTSQMDFKTDKLVMTNWNSSASRRRHRISRKQQIQQHLFLRFVDGDDEQRLGRGRIRRQSTLPTSPLPMNIFVSH